MSFSEVFNGLLQVFPWSLARSKSLARVARQFGDLLIVEGVAKARHCPMGRVFDAVQDDVEEVVRAVQVQVCIQAKGRSLIEHGRPASRLVADRACTVEQTRGFVCWSMSFRRCRRDDVATADRDIVGR